MDYINTSTYADAIGFSVYCFEGIGVIMPVQDITANPKNYRGTVYGVIITVAVLYISFGLFCVIAWGGTLDESPLITDKLP